MAEFLESPWPFVVPWIWIALVVTASIFRRRKIGKPIFPKPPTDAVFVEKRSSGRSLNNWWNRIGGANNCLLVGVTPTTLTVTPQFPFNLMFLPEIYGLEFIVSRQAITTVESKPGLFGDTVVVKAGDTVFELRLRDSNGFRHALGR